VSPRSTAVPDLCSTRDKAEQALLPSRADGRAVEATTPPGIDKPTRGYVTAMGSSGSSPPPTEKVQIGQWALGTFTELRLLRAALREALSDQPMPAGGSLDSVPDKMAVIATELAANAMAHAKPPTTVRLFRTETTFILDVADNDPWVVPQFAGERPVRAAGLGLFLARKLSLDIGWYVADGTKHVWAQVAIPMTRRDPGEGPAQP
jgi:serine/threonine-protein kinase RsbW